MPLSLAGCALFQSTPSRRGRRLLVYRVPKPQDFNPLPQEEGDMFASTSNVASSDFNPLPQEEGDNFFIVTSHIYVNFNPLPQEEGDLMKGVK